MASTVSFGDRNAGFQAGAVHGSVNVTFHPTPERPETPPRPSIVIPFARDDDFIDRGTALDQIHQICSIPGSRAALVGLGGVGKSQLAIEYAYRTHKQSPETWVFWVHASNTARFEQSYRDIADYVKIFGRQDPKANIFKLVHDWLRDSKEQWLLVLDNVDDARFLLSVQVDGRGQSTRPLREYLPHCERGSILVTTRSKEAALKLIEKHNIIAVEPMDGTQAHALFKKKLDVQGDDGDIPELIESLENMPLAIVQAAAYISQRAPRYTVAKYLKEFKKSERKRISLLNYDEGQLQRDWEAKNSIIITWQISFEYIQQTRPSAADLLSLMSFFDRQGIPESVLRTRNEQALNQGDQQEGKEDIDNDDEDSTSQSSTSDDGFEDDIVALRNFSFISVNIDGTAFEMHALVQLATRKWLQATNELKRWNQQFISNLCAEFPIGAHENWPVCQALFAHAKSAAGQQPEGESSLVQWATLLYRAAWYAYEIGNFVDAENFAVKSMRTTERMLGQEHEETLDSKSMLGSVYRLAGRWDAAEALEVGVMETRKKKFGVDHPDTLASMGNLASTYWNQGRWDAAEALEVEVMETRKKKLGVDHPDTLASMADLASIYQKQGRWDVAEMLNVEVMETRKKKLGVDHPGTLISMANLALTYQSQGRWDAAEALEVEVMETRKKKLGVDHPDTLISMGNLALTYQSQGRWGAAEALEVEVMETRKKKLGMDHPDTLISMGNLALSYWNQGRWDAAEALGVEVMETCKKKLGVDHPDTLTSMGNLASTYSKQGRWDAAEALEVEVMETRKKKLGVDHPDTLTSMGNLALVYLNQGQWGIAEVLEVEVMETRKKKFGAGHPDTLTSMGNLASTYSNQGRWDAAEALEVEVMETRKKKFGVDHPKTLISMANLALTYWNQGRWDAAEALEVEVMETRKKKLGVDHPDTLAIMANLASTWKSQGRDMEAVCLIRECVKLCQRVLGVNHPTSKDALANLGKWEGEFAESNKL